MLVLTAELSAILKSKLQAGPYGFRSRIEVDFSADMEPEPTLVQSGTDDSVVYEGTTTVVLASPPIEGNTLVGMTANRGTDSDDMEWPAGWTVIATFKGQGFDGGTAQIAYRVAGPAESSTISVVKASSCNSSLYVGEFAGLGSMVASAFDDEVGPSIALESGPLAAGTGDRAVFAAFNQSSRGGGIPGGETADFAYGDGYTRLFNKQVDASGPAVCLGWKVIPDASGDQFSSAGATMEDGYGWAMASFVDAVLGPSSLGTPSRVSIDKSLRMASDQAVVEFVNEDQLLGWGPSSPWVTNARIRIYQWYGSPDNEVRTFTGVLDSILHGRDPLTVTLKARDMMAIMLDQGFTTIGPQGADEEGKIRTTANGVYLSMEVSAIVEDILLRAGWPQADTSITPTSYVLDEFIIQDGSSWADAIIGDDRLTGLVGYNAWADEDGVFHFEPSELEASATEILSPSYTFRTGEDIVQLANEIDQYDLRTRVKVRGPLTTQELSDTWRELWRTKKMAHPVGVWYDPSNSGYIRVLDRGTKRLYKLRQSDRVLVSSVYVGSICPYPLAVSGDPANSAYYYLLNCPWKFGGSLGGNSIKKIRKSDNKVLSSWSIPSGRWTGMKVSSNYIWLTNWDTDRFYKRSKADASAIASYSHTYGGNEQHNPSGLMIDGTTLNLFWANGGTTARFLQASESAPGTVTKKVKTAGTTLHGGEMDTTTHTECWGVNDSTGVTAKFTLIKAEDHTTEVYAEVIDSELEDELGVLALLEDRIHDAHSGDPAHPFEVRRDTLDVTVITSLAQATETAMRRLDSLARRRDVVDAGIVGNPALQKTDVVRVLDPKVDSARDYVIDTYRTEMDASGTYLGTLALIPIAEVTDDPVDEGDIESGPEIVPMPITLTFVVTSPIDPDSSVRYWPMLALTSS